MLASPSGIKAPLTRFGGFFFAYRKAFYKGAGKIFMMGGGGLLTAGLHCLRSFYSVVGICVEQCYC